jgi:hypothetical protein
MNLDSYITRPSSDSKGDRLVGRLQNVFRVLSKPEHERREEAIKLREEISSTWGDYVNQNRWFPWPTTIASLGTRRLKGIDWRPYGALSYLGYHVGETQPTQRDVRWQILEYAFEYQLPPLDSRTYYLEWGQPQTAQRLKKLANTLAALTRNAKRKDAVSYASAIDDWERDLVLLHDRYYRNLFHFGWPATDHLH